MKKIFSLFLSLMVLVNLQAQTAGEWLQQKKTRLRYLLEQLIALKAYAEVIEKSYSVAHTGLTLISGIKGDDLNLHQSHNAALLAVSPAVRRYWKLQSCQTLAGEIEKSNRQARKVIRQSAVFTVKEKGYAEAVLVRMDNHKEELIDWLGQVTGDGNSTLSDAERIDQIDTFYASLVELKKATSAYEASLQIMSLQKERELRDIQTAARLYKQ